VFFFYKTRQHQRTYKKENLSADYYFMAEHNPQQHRKDPLEKSGYQNIIIPKINTAMNCRVCHFSKRKTTTAFFFLLNLLFTNMTVIHAFFLSQSQTAHFVGHYSCYSP